MNLPDLKAFIALAETGSINRASRRLGLTQPATTRRVQNFEASMGGAALLDRRVKPPVLTATGRQVLAHCQRVLKAVAELEACVSNDSEPAGDLRIGVSPGLADAVLSTPLDDVRSRFPGLQLRVTSQWTTPLIDAVSDCALDCAIALVTDHHTLPAGVTGSLMAAEPLVVVGPRGLAYATKHGRALRLGDLEQHGWVLNPVGCGYREALLRAFDRAKASCRLVADVLGYDLQLSLIARGAGLGLVPRRLVDKSPVRQRLRILKVADFAPEARVMMLRGTSLGSLGVAVDYLQARFVSGRKKLA
ncbi:MAG: LysR family transcriptional regulator [Stellaceae bacterium]